MKINAPTMAEVAAERVGKSFPKGQSRLETSKAETKLTVVTEKDFLKAVRTRYRMHCCWCERAVLLVVERVPNRAEVHHLHGRNGPFRFEARCAILLCCECHEKLTGRVAEKWIVVGTAWFELQTKRETVTCIDARQPVKFERVA